MQPDHSNTQQRTQATSYDAGLRTHMQMIYNRMTLGVFITAITSFFVANTPALLSLFLGGPQAYVIMLAPLAIVWFGFNPMTMSSEKLRLSFIGISLLYGISFATIFFYATGENIARAFFVAAGMFAGLSIFGYTTKKNLDALMSFCIMGVFGVLIMSLLNMFIFKSAGMFDLISAVGIIAFSGLTAWQTQNMKEMYTPSAGAEGNSRMAWSAALSLYISFIALFQYILHFMNQR